VIERRQSSRRFWDWLLLWQSFSRAVCCSNSTGRSRSQSASHTAQASIGPSVRYVAESQHPISRPGGTTRKSNVMLSETKHLATAGQSYVATQILRCAQNDTHHLMCAGLMGRFGGSIHPPNTAFRESCYYAVISTGPRTNCRSRRCCLSEVPIMCHDRLQLVRGEWRHVAKRRARNGNLFFRGTGFFA